MAQANSRLGFCFAINLAETAQEQEGLAAHPLFRLITVPQRDAFEPADKPGYCNSLEYNHSDCTYQHEQREEPDSRASDSGILSPELAGMTGGASQRRLDVQDFIDSILTDTASFWCATVRFRSHPSLRNSLSSR